MHKWHFFLVHLKLLFIIIWIYCIKTKSLEKICLLHILNRQYRSLLVPTSCEQTEMAKSHLKTAPQASKTVVVEGSKFITAEARHQKNRLRRDPAMVRCLVQSGHEDFTSSYLATRLNGWELNFLTFYNDWISGVSTLIEFMESLHWLNFWSLYIDWFSGVSTLIDFLKSLHCSQVSWGQGHHGSVQQGVAGPWPEQRPGFSHQKSNH